MSDNQYYRYVNICVMYSCKKIILPTYWHIQDLPERQAPDDLLCIEPARDVTAVRYNNFYTIRMHIMACTQLV